MADERLTDEELKALDAAATLPPCPFCGGRATLQEWSNTPTRSLWEIGCYECDMWLDPGKLTVDACVTAWSTRSGQLVPAVPDATLLAAQIAIDPDTLPHVVALEQAIQWFDDYATQHLTKARDANEQGEFQMRCAKGKLNKERADYLRAALADPSQFVPVPDAAMVEREQYDVAYKEFSDKHLTMIEREPTPDHCDDCHGPIRLKTRIELLRDEAAYILWMALPWRIGLSWFGYWLLQYAGNYAFSCTCPAKVLNS